MIYKEEIDLTSWFKNRLWLEHWNVTPHPTIDVSAFSSAYFDKPDLWRQAFKFLNDSDLLLLPVGIHKIDGDDLFALVQEYVTLDEVDTCYEAHRLYADIQHIVSGSERIGISPTARTSELGPYNESRDIVFLHTDTDVYHLASDSHFFIFFPGDAHKPCVVHETRKPIRKIVLKVRL